MYKEFLMYNSVSNTKRDTFKVSKYFSNCQVIFNVFFFLENPQKMTVKKEEGKIPFDQIPRLLRKQVKAYH